MAWTFSRDASETRAKGAEKIRHLLTACPTRQQVLGCAEVPNGAREAHDGSPEWIGRTSEFSESPLEAVRQPTHGPGFRSAANPDFKELIKWKEERETQGVGVFTFSFFPEWPPGKLIIITVFWPGRQVFF